MTSTRNKALFGVFVLFLVTAGIIIPMAMISPPESPNLQMEILSNYETGGFTFDVDVLDDIAYLSVAKEPGPSELIILNVSDPSNPTELGCHDLEGYPDQLAVSNSIVFITDRFGPLSVINVTNPSNPEEIGEYPDSEGVYDIEIVGDVGYLGTWNDGLIVLNISEPANPVLIGEYATMGAANQLDIVGDLLYLSDHRSTRTGLVVLNISNPTNPTRLCNYLPDDELWNPHVFGDYIYCGNHELDEGDLIILDTSDPANVIEVDQFSFGSSVNSISIIDDIAYVAGGHHALDLLDVSDPTTPTFITTLNGVEAGRDLVVLNDIVFLGCDGWFYIIQVSET